MLRNEQEVVTICFKVSPPLPQYVFMAWCLVKRRDNFTFCHLHIQTVTSATSQQQRFKHSHRPLLEYTREELRKTTKKPQSGQPMHHLILKPSTSWIQVMYVTAWVTSLVPAKFISWCFLQSFDFILFNVIEHRNISCHVPTVVKCEGCLVWYPHFSSITSDLSVML